MPERNCPVCQAPLPAGQDACSNCAPPAAPPPAAAPGIRASAARWWSLNWLSALVFSLLAAATVCLLLSADVSSTRRSILESLTRLSLYLNQPSSAADSGLAGTVAIGADSDHGAAVDFGPIKIGSHSTTAVSVTILTAGVLDTISVVTQGVADLDFTNAGSGTCTPGVFYPANSTCTVNVTFSPKVSGTRYGAVVLQDSQREAIKTRHIPMATGYLTGVGKGAQLIRSESPILRIGTGWILPWGVELDTAGNIYVANYPRQPYESGGSVIRETPVAGGYRQTTIGSGFVGPSGIAVDGAGNIYVADASLQVIFRETPYKDGYVQSQIPAPGLGWPLAVAVDGGGNVYVTDGPNRRVLKESLFAGQYRQTSIPTSLAYPIGLAVDRVGNIYAANGDVVKETLDGATYRESRIATGYGGVMGRGAELTIDPEGNLLIAATAQNQIIMLPALGDSFGRPIVLASVSHPFAVDSSASGDLFYTTDIPGDAGLWRMPILLPGHDSTDNPANRKRR